MARLALEKATHQQKMRVEVSQAKREADFFKDGVEKSKRLERKKRKRNKSKTETAGQESAKKHGQGEDDGQSPPRKYFFREKEPDEVVR